MISYNPSIVRNGLVLHLDAANVKSYPGTGTVWKDLSGNGNNGTMIGTVPTAVDVTNCFDFTSATGTASANASLGFSLNAAINTALGNYSFDCWIKTSQVMSQHTLLSNAGADNGFRFGPGANGVYALCGPNYAEGLITWNSTYNANAWHHVVAVFDRDGSLSAGSPRVHVYLDGVYQRYMQLPSPQTSQATIRAGIVRNPCCQIWKGKLSLLKVYNRSLSISDVQKNYSANSGRFGL